MSDTKRGHYFKFERGAWIAEADQPAQHFAASGLSYAGNITLEQRNELDRLIASFLEHGRDIEIATLRQRAEEAEAKCAAFERGFFALLTGFISDNLTDTKDWHETALENALRLFGADPEQDLLHHVGAAIDAARKETPK